MSYQITSQQNERIKRLVRLRDRRHRNSEGVFVVEGSRLFKRAVESGLHPLEVYASTPVEGHETTTVAPEVLDKASYRSKSEGVIAVFEQWSLGLDNIADRSLVLVTEDIEKPGNVGAMLRTAAAAGASGVVAVGEPVDVFNPNALRASTGAIFSVPMAAGSWDEIGSWLTRTQLIATSPEATAAIWDVDMTGPTAIAVGAEDVGLSDRAFELATQTVTIPQADGATDSLNASVAAGIALFEGVRQRSRSPE